MHSGSGNACEIMNFFVLWSKLFGAITGPLGTSLKACGADTWDSVRNLVKQETEVVDTEFASDVARFDIDKEELEKKLKI